MNIKWKKHLILLSILTLLLGGCSQEMKVSADEIIHNAIESEKELTTYEGKAEMKLYEGEKLVDHAIIHESMDDGKRKIVTEDQINKQITEALNDGKKLLMYDKGAEEAFEIDLGELDGLENMSPKEQFKMMLESMGDSHTYEVVGEEKVLDFDTYHIKVKANEKDSLLGDMELWVEQDTWFVVKLTSETGEMKNEIEYMELNFSPKFDADTFTLEIPENVEISGLEESFGPEPVTLEEAEEALGQTFLVFSEEEMQLSEVNMYDFSEGLGRHEVELNYTTDEDIPLVTLSVFPAEEEMDLGGNDVTIRGQEGAYEETIKGFFWDEDGLRYSLLITNPDMDKEEILKLTESMKLSSEE